VQGQVRSGGEPVQARVSLDRVSDGSFDYYADQTTGENGIFSLECPFGSYKLSLRTASGEWFYYSKAGFVADHHLRDTLQINAERNLYDLQAELALLKVILSLPPTAGADVVTIAAYESDGDGGYRRELFEGTRVEDELVELDFAGVAPGSLRLYMEVRGAYGEESFWLPGTRDEQLADDIVIQGTGTTVYSRSMGAPALVRGSATGSWLTFSNKSARVRLLNSDSVRVADPIVDREAEGVFHCPLYAPEPFRVRVRIEDQDLWVGGHDFASATEFHPESGNTIAGVDFVESGILLDVTDPFYGNLEGLGAEIYRAEAPEVVFYNWYPRNDGSPQTALSGLPSGTYYVRLVNPSFQIPWSTQWINRVLTFEDALAIDLTDPGSVAVIDVSLLPGGTVRGTIEWGGIENPGSDGWPRYYRGRIYAVDSQSLEVIGSKARYLSRNPRTVDFELRGARPGGCKFGICYSNHSLPDTPPDSTIWYPGTLDWEQAETFEVVSEGLIEGIDFTMP